MKCLTCKKNIPKQNNKFCSMKCKHNFKSKSPKGIIVKKLDISDFYAVSKCGKVWSYKSGRFLKGTINGMGYVQVELNLEGKGKIFLVHRLVALTYIKNKKNLPEINHKDGNKKNNHYKNLEWTTSSKNQKHAYDTKLQIHKKGEDWHISKLTEDDVKFIRNNCKHCSEGSLNYSELSEIFGVCSATVRDVAIGRTWKHVF